MKPNDLNTALYEKMAAEQDKYRDWLKSQPPAEVLNHAYEYTVREDIVMAMEQLELTDAQAQALLESPTPLADVYRHFERKETGYMDMIRDSIENRADDECKMKEPPKGHALVVEPGKTPYIKDISFSLESLQKEVGGDIQAVYPFSEPIALICNEEGKLDGSPLNRALRDENGHIYDVMAGTFLVVGLGEDHFASLSSELIERFTEQFKTPESFARINGKLMVLPMEETPPKPSLYLRSAAYASEHGELREYRLSNRANVACKQAIEQAIRSHYGNNHLDAEGALQEVLKQFTPERVQFILANTVRHKDWDGRISNDNKAWAKTIPMLEDEDPQRTAYFVVDQVHPGLTDLLIKKVRQVFSEPEKGSVLQKLKQEVGAHKLTTPQKREPER